MNKPTDESKPAEILPVASVHKTRISWFIWVIPIAALVFVGWLVYKNTIAKGPEITIYFKNAGGIDPGNTQVKCRGTPVGTVKEITLTQDKQWAAVKTRLEHNAKDIAREGSVFWIVQPQLSVGGIRGLQTIMSGSFIEVRPGSGAPTTQFTGLEQPPPVIVPGPALKIELLAPEVGSLQEQSPIFYRGIQVGEVLHFQLSPDSQDVIIQARIKAEYAPLVRRNSVFWNAGGINVSLSVLHGISISAESAKALAAGAIEFATPDKYDEPAPDGTGFRLFEKSLPDWKNWRPAIRLNLPPHAVSPTNPAPASLTK